MDVRFLLDQCEYRRAEKVLRHRRGDVLPIISNDSDDSTESRMCGSCGTWHREIRCCPFCHKV